MKINWKIFAVVAILVALSAGITYANANQYDTEAYADTIRSVILACGVYLVGWLKAAE